MADNSPQAPDRKRGLFAPLVIAGAVGALLVGVAVGRFSRPSPPEPTPAPAPAPESKSIEIKPPPLPPPALTRQDLIVKAREAAADYASGAARPTSSDPLMRRAFRVRLPFGCAGSQTGPGSAQAYYDQDAERRTIKIVARPVNWTNLPLVQSLPDAADIEQVEGFWIPRPWLMNDDCPPRREAPPPATPTAPAAQTLGLAQISDTESSRVSQRGGRPYEFVQKLPADATLSGARRYRLVIEGHIGAFPGGGSVRCWSEGPDHRPLCLFAADFDRIAFEDEAGTVLAEWRD